MSFPNESMSNGRPIRPHLPGCGPLNLSNARGRHTREYLDAHKNVEKRRRDRINTCLETIRQFVPACRKVPLSRRLEKGEILDMTISYLQLVNHFLAGIGVHDVYSASKQEVRLYMGVDNWIREHQNDYTSVSEFAKDIRSLLQNEMEAFTTQITMEHTWSSRKASTYGDLYTEDSLDDGYNQAASCQSEADYEDNKPFIVPSTSNCQETSPPLTTASSVRIKQECYQEKSSAEPPVKKLKFSEVDETTVNDVCEDDCHLDGRSSEESSQHQRSFKQSTNIVANSSASSPPSSESCHCNATCSRLQERTSCMSQVAPNPHTGCSSLQRSVGSPCSSVGDVKVSTSMGCITIPIRLGSIQIEAPKEMLQPLQQACIQPIVFNAQIESSDCTADGDRCKCKTQQQSQGLSIQVTEAKGYDSSTKDNKDNV
ncbi:uncharacterized protein [Amphiura filiformis]|uniref:uncharacterized protein n=1 Tax=Amphiura filiformis TaxID=82378 RepID=UPI003B224BF5